MHFTIFGGAGFIGSHLCSHLIDHNHQVLVIDSAKSHNNIIENLHKSGKIQVINLDIKHTESLLEVVPKGTSLIHLASNADIAAAASNPRIDFVNGTLLTESALEVARLAKAKHFIYASGSGVYKENPHVPLVESDELLPLSTYGASKLAGESLASAYSFMFGLKVTILRFANVVGQYQTHGIGYDFMRKLKSDPTKLDILGDGSQTKSYVDVMDICTAIDTVIATQNELLEIFNLSNEDTITVKEIAKLAIKIAGINEDSVQFKFGPSPRGWVGDVPVIKLNSSKLRKLGWVTTFSSLESITRSLDSIWKEINS